MKNRIPSLTIFIGCIIGVFQLILSALIAGAGHGWTTPFWFGIAGMIAYPLAMLSLFRSWSTSVYVIIIAAAIVSNVLLFGMTGEEGYKYFYSVTPYNYVWIATWLIWQIAIFVSFSRSRTER